MKLTSTERLQMYKPCEHCYAVIHMDNSLNYEIVNHDLYRGSDVLKRFILKIEEVNLAIQEDLSVSAKMIMIPGDLETFKEVKEY